MSAGTRLSGLWLIGAMILLPACWSFGDDPSYQSLDTSPPEPCRADGGPPAPAPLVCNGQCKDFVFDSLELPLTSSDAQKTSFVLQNKKYNVLGNILALLAQQAGEMFTPRGCTTRLLNMGRIVTLLRLKDPGSKGELGMGAKTWIGQKHACCPRAQSWSACASEARTTCFAGKTAFSADRATESLFGAAGASHYSLNGPRINLQLSMDCKTAVTVTLYNVQLSGSYMGDRIEDGGIAGVIPRQVVDNVLIPWMARGLDAAYQSADSMTRDMIKQLFDRDGDQKITTAEFADNMLVKTLLAGDVDADCDGTNELSMGLGFSAVPAVIND